MTIPRDPFVTSLPDKFRIFHTNSTEMFLIEVTAVIANIHSTMNCLYLTQKLRQEGK